MFNIRNFIIRLVINAIAIALTAKLLPGISIHGGIGTVILIALIFGIVNAIVKPILIILTLPVVILTLGLFILVINALLLLLVSAILGNNFVVDGFVTALIGGIIMAIIAMIVEWVLDRIGFAESK